MIRKIRGMLQNLLIQQKAAINTYFEKLDLVETEKLIKRISACQGMVFFTGVGKSGFIGQKIAATLQSTGTKAFFLSPIDALHGDLGMMGAQDLLVILSKSGETEELLALLPAIRNKGAKIVALTAEKSSRLAQSVDHVVVLPCESELCPFDLAPTTSTEVQLLFGDLLAVALMQAKELKLETFALNHPAGRIGKRATLKVKDLMVGIGRVPLCPPESRLEEILGEFSGRQCGCVLVTDAQRKLQGIFTDGDLRRALEERGGAVLSERLETLMTRLPKTASPEALAWEALQLMEANQNSPITVLPVVSQGEVVGLLKMHDLIQSGL